MQAAPEAYFARRKESMMRQIASASLPAMVNMTKILPATVMVMLAPDFLEARLLGDALGDLLGGKAPVVVDDGRNAVLAVAADHLHAVLQGLGRPAFGHVDGEAGEAGAEFLDGRLASPCHQQAECAEQGGEQSFHERTPSKEMSWGCGYCSESSGPLAFSMSPAMTMTTASSPSAVTATTMGTPSLVPDMA